jgi:hypothetical protein
MMDEHMQQPHAAYQEKPRQLREDIMQLMMYGLSGR